MLPSKIISGGQTGVDRAALDFAINRGIPHGGWCPRGRLAEDGVIPEKYQLSEMASAEYSERTKQNITDADATLILVNALPLTVTDGTVLTIEEVIKQAKPHLVVSLNDLPEALSKVEEWIASNHFSILNIAGPRESQSPGIYSATIAFLNQITFKNQVCLFKKR